MKIKPDPKDFVAVERIYGKAPPNATQSALANRYRMAQAIKLFNDAATTRITELSKNKRLKPS